LRVFSAKKEDCLFALILRELNFIVTIAPQMYTENGRLTYMTEAHKGMRVASNKSCFDGDVELQEREDDRVVFFGVCGIPLSVLHGCIS
jgi:hypothetical protein